MWSLNSNSPWSQAGLNDFFKGIECSGHDTMRLITRSQKKQYTIYLVFPLSLVHASLDLWAVMCVCACVCVCGQLCLTLCDPMDCSPQGSSVHGISQARILEWVAISFSRGSSWPMDQTCVSCIAGRFFTTEPPGNSYNQMYSSVNEWVNDMSAIFLNNFILESSIEQDT